MSNLGRIFIADDEEVFLVSTARLLEKRGHQCQTATNATDAAEILGSEDFDLLIADIRMPGNTNLELIKDLPQISKGLPVILVTGYPSIETAITALDLPVVSYLVKPLDIDELVESAQRAIDSYRMYSNINDALQHSQFLTRDLENIEKVIGGNLRDHTSMPADMFISLNLKNILNGICNLAYIVDIHQKHNGDQEICRLFNCPRLQTLIETLVETTRVLEKTRSSFKSKEIGQLRLKLAKIIADMIKYSPDAKVLSPLPDKTTEN